MNCNAENTTIDLRADKPATNAPGWHVVKLDDSAYTIVKKERERLKKTHHASFSDAIRELKRKR